MVAVKSFATGYAPWRAALSAAGAHHVVGRDGMRETRSGLLMGAVLDGWLQHAKR